MLIDTIKKENLLAMKEKNAAKRSALSEVITRYGVLSTSGNGKQLSDSDLIKIIMKVDKELDEEIASFEAAGRSESVANLKAQKAELAPFIPKLMGEEEIRQIIAGLDDKSIPAVMKYFKEHHAGACDMGLVSKIARGQ